MADYNPGDIVRVSTTPGFKNTAGALTDPTTVSLAWRVAGGATTTWVYLTDSQVVRDSVGLFHADIPVTVAGLHYFRWVGTGAVVAAEESTFSVGSAFLSTSVTSLAEVRALVQSRLSDIDLQAVIDREEAWLAGRVGTLTGERTDTWTPGLGDTPLYLQRRAESVVLVDNGRTLAASEFLFTPSTGMIRRVWASDFVDRHRVYLGWAGDVTATYTPSDTAAVKRAVIELIRGTVGETGLDAETIGDYSYTRGESTGRVGRAGLARSILLRRPAYSMRLRPGWEPA